MLLTDVVLVVFIALLLCYAQYDEFGMDLLKVQLSRCQRIDCLIFGGLIAILIYRNVTIGGALLTTYLLISLALMTFYISYIRWPKILFKAQGFFYANTFIAYNRIKAMNLSQDGVLVIELQQRRLLIQVAQLDGLKKIHQLFIENQ
ncbi:putative conserved inner membrane protein [Serratia symbiotica str. Tucson]|uniref:UPF0266 membrane protein SSYM_2003 n=2 Tax=Serratia symbiotica TaxID=138074 RepID=E9CNK1_9GAMM|nr:DUF986 family protein [Serratia symbiotica]EFW11782.1 putative conserved inner membrane protein [Serratia symbiotica str. Tucson]BBI92430.1 uncharacterized membrane protein [Serratia symbiotica]